MGGNLVICNLQKTPLTEMAAMHIYAATDTVMQMLMELLSLSIPPFQLLRRLIFGRSGNAGQLYSKAVDVHDPTIEVDHLRAIDWDGNGLPQNVVRDATAATSQTQGVHRHNGGSNLRPIRPKLHFMGHYHEPPLDLL